MNQIEQNNLDLHLIPEIKEIEPELVEYYSLIAAAAEQATLKHLREFEELDRTNSSDIQNHLDVLTDIELKENPNLIISEENKQIAINAAEDQKALALLMSEPEQKIFYLSLKMHIKGLREKRSKAGRIRRVLGFLSEEEADNLPE